MEEDLLEEVSGLFTVLLTISFYLTQITPYFKLIRGKLQFQDTPTFYIVSCYYNCLLWFIYGEIIFNEKYNIAI